MKKWIAVFFLFAGSAFAQSNSGELRLKVTDPSGLGVKTTVQIISEANQYRNTLATNDQGALDVQRLPYGIYQLEISSLALRRSPNRSKFVPRFRPNTRSNSSCQR